MSRAISFTHSQGLRSHAAYSTSMIFCHKTRFRARMCRQRSRGLRVFADSTKGMETPEMAQARRLKESQRVEERVTEVTDMKEFEHELESAGSKLVVLEVQSDKVCQSGVEDEQDLPWKADRERNQQRCVDIKHVFQRTARECPDVKFLSLQTDPSCKGLASELGVTVLPTVQFYRNGVKLWEHQGAMNMQADIGEGVLYYGNTAGNGLVASEFVYQLESRSAYEKFLHAQDDKVLTVLYVALMSASPCVHIYPAVLALARSFVGYAAFGRLIGDTSPEMQGLLEELKVQQVPTFIFFRGGKEVHRHVGSSRGDLIGKILEQQAAAGISPPPAPKKPPVPKKTPVRR